MESIRLECPRCGNKQEGHGVCPVTGWTYSKGWHIRCSNCSSNLKKVEPEIQEEKTPATKCDICFAKSFVIYRIKSIRGYNYLNVCCTCKDEYFRDRN
jgi:hypothetical protein